MNTRMFLSCLLLLGSITAWSAEVNLALTDDASIHGNNPTLNQGSTSTLTVHSVGPKQGLVRFDASSLTGKTVQSATLSLLLNSIRDPGLVTVHAVTSTWSEGTVTWAAQPSAEASAVSSASISASNVGSLVAFDVTAIAQRWADGTLSDFGLLIKTSDSIRAAFDSKEKSGAIAAILNVVTDDVPPPPTPGVGTPPVVLDLSNPPVVIDQPGHYILDQDWEIRGLPTSINVIDMQVNAILDLSGFQISVYHIGGAVVAIGSEGGTVINGRISMGGEATTGIRSVGTAIVREVSISTAEQATALSLSGARSEVFKVSILGDFGVTIRGDWSSLRSSNVGCNEFCLSVYANSVEITDSTFSAAEGGGYPHMIEGDNNIFARNTVLFSIHGPAIGIGVSGDGNLIFGNAFRDTTTAIELDGSGNFVKDNISMPGTGGIGINFLQDGNFYRNNQMSAITPFELNGTVQTDLGGNVGY